MNRKERSLDGKVALVTGSGRGIGAATAKLLVRAGARVVLTSRTQSELDQVATEIETECGRGSVLAVSADVSQEAHVQKVFAQSLERFGPVEILVNNAATVLMGNFADLKSKDWDEVMAVNLRSAFLCSREVFRQLQKSGKTGAIVNLSSLAGIRGTEKFKGLSTYIVSKFGVIGLTETLAVEGKEFGIRVNCVAPGAVETAMLKKAAPFLKTKTQPEDVAKVIYFLVDDSQSGALNGAVLEIFSNM